MKNHNLGRTTFTMSRQLEFFTDKELAMQIGHARDQWPLAILKELIDNGLDACEQAGIPPEFLVVIEPHALHVQDNGPGIPLTTIQGSLDYQVRVSNKSVYISPTRGQLGNALKCVWAAGFVANGQHGIVEVEVGDHVHKIDVSLDQLRQKPQIALTTTPASVVKTGTLFKMHWTEIASYLNGAKCDDFYNAHRLLLAYAAFNPHVHFTLKDDQETVDLVCQVPHWRKWLPQNPMCPWWYTTEQLKSLLAAYLTKDERGPERSVREIVVGFAGLSSTAKSKAVLEACGLSGKRLQDLVRNGDLDTEIVARLLGIMQQATKQIKPKALGVLGAEHLTNSLANQHFVDRRSVRYKCVAALTDTGLPFVLEVAFGVHCQGHEQERNVLVGLNWSPAIRLPFQELNDLLGAMRIDEDDPATVLVHLACPRLEYIDRGKGSIRLPIEIKDALAKCIRSVAKSWKKEKRQADKEDRLSQQQLERVRKAKRSKQMNLKEAGYAVMKGAYLKAGEDDKDPEKRHPANARQIMYAARPRVLELTGGECWSKSSYFTQRLLPDFLKENPVLTADWDVVFDARGHLTEPHTRRRIDLGTLEVREYIASWHNGCLEKPPKILLDQSCPTIGPANRFRYALFVEKEGFGPLLHSAAIGERFDVAIMSTKGMSVTAARQLVERLSECGVTILVLHDFDKSGFSILHTLQTDTRRHKFKTKPRVVDIGLRLDDVRALELQTEAVHYRRTKRDPRIRLRACGATQEECDFLVRQKTSISSWEGDRVELNAMTAAQFIRYLEQKLTAAGAVKVVPDQQTLEIAFKQACRTALLQQTIDAAAQANGAVNLPLPPANLQKRIAKLIKGTQMPWDEAIWNIVGEHLK